MGSQRPQNGTKMEPAWGQDGAQTFLENLKNRVQIFLENRKAITLIRPLHFSRKCGQHGPKLGPKMEPKRWKNRCPHWSKNRCLLESMFEGMLVDLGRENAGKLAPTNDQKSKPRLKRKNQVNISGLLFSWLSGSQVGSPNRSKINQKRRSTWEGILASIFHRCWWIWGAKLGGKIDPRSIKKGIEKTMKKWRVICIDFRSILVPSWAPS